jgi:hypothetical protein
MHKLPKTPIFRGSLKVLKSSTTGRADGLGLLAPQRRLIATGSAASLCTRHSYVSHGDQSAMLEHV